MSREILPPRAEGAIIRLASSPSIPLADYVATFVPLSCRADHGKPVPDARFPLIQDGSSERPGAVKGAPPGAAKRTLYGEDRSERIAKEGNEAFDF